MFAYPLAQNLSDGNRQLAGRRMIVMRVMNRMFFDRDVLEQYFWRAGGRPRCAPHGGSTWQACAMAVASFG